MSHVTFGFQCSYGCSDEGCEIQNGKEGKASFMQMTWLDLLGFVKDSTWDIVQRLNHILGTIVGCHSYMKPLRS